MPPLKSEQKIGFFLDMDLRLRLNLRYLAGVKEPEVLYLIFKVELVLAGFSYLDNDIQVLPPYHVRKRLRGTLGRVIGTSSKHKFGGSDGYRIIGYRRHGEGHEIHSFSVEVEINSHPTDFGR
jgi:hypothetical protein